MNRFAWIVTVPIALMVVLFALMNRQAVALSLWPFPWEITAPLFLFTLGAVVFGFFFGALTAWLSGGKTRQKLRTANRRLAETHDELTVLKRQQAPKESPAILHRPPTALPPAA